MTDRQEAVSRFPLQTDEQMFHINRALEYAVAELIHH